MKMQIYRRYSNKMGITRKIIDDIDMLGTRF